MRMHLINDWRYLFDKDAIGGRFASFTFAMISYFHSGAGEWDGTGEPLDIDGLTVIVLGLGVRVRKGTSHDR